MSMIKVLIDGNETMINKSKLLYFQDALGAELVEEVKEVKKQPKKQPNKEVKEVKKQK